MYRSPAKPPPPVPVFTEPLLSALDAALASLSDRRGEALARSIRPVLLANLDRGRIGSFTGGDLQRLPEYVDRVADSYARQHLFIEALQKERAGRVWEPLFARMVKWAYAYFIRKNFYPSKETQETANQCATEAAIAMLDAHFPYDTDFDPWAHVIVINLCLKHVRRQTQKTTIPDQDLAGLEEAVGAAGDLSSFDLRLSDRLALSEAMAQLTESRRRLLEWLYFEGLSPGEVAERTGKRLNAVYSQHFNALADLRRILMKDFGPKQEYI